MYRLQFSSRLRLCRAAFVLLCVLPTMIVAGAAVLTHSPPFLAARKVAFQRQLSACLGLDVDVAKLDTVAAGGLRIEGLELREPETHEWIARARSVEVLSGDEGLVVALGQPEIRFARLSRLTEILHEHILKRTGARTDRVCHLTTGSLTLHDDEQSQSLLDVHCVVDGDQASKDEGTEILLAFRMAGADSDEPARLRVVRNRQLSPPGSGWEFHTGPAALPCSLAAGWFPGLERIGRDCTFSGSIWAEQGPLGWDSEISGTLHQLDLDKVITGQFPHKLSGRAELQVAPLKIERGRVASLSGSLHSAGGVISRSLLEAAQDSLGMEYHQRPGDAVRLGYSQLALRFSIDAHDLTLVGAAEMPATVLMDSHGPLLSASEIPLPPVALLRMLVPENDLLVPATRETAALFHSFPLPRVSRPESRGAQIPYRPLRLLR